MIKKLEKKAIKKLIDEGRCDINIGEFRGGGYNYAHRFNLIFDINELDIKIDIEINTGDIIKTNLYPTLDGWREKYIYSLLKPKCKKYLNDKLKEIKDKEELKIKIALSRDKVKMEKLKDIIG